MVVKIIFVIMMVVLSGCYEPEVHNGSLTTEVSNSKNINYHMEIDGDRPVVIYKGEIMINDGPLFVLDDSQRIKRIEHPQGTIIEESPYHYNNKRYIMVTIGDGEVRWWQH